jgi:hypothetical protein
MSGWVGAILPAMSMPEDLASLEETLSVLADPAVMEAIREAETEVAAGRTERLTKDPALGLTRYKRLAVSVVLDRMVGFGGAGNASTAREGAVGTNEFVEVRVE